MKTVSKFLSSNYDISIASRFAALVHYYWGCLGFSNMYDDADTFIFTIPLTSSRSLTKQEPLHCISYEVHCPHPVPSLKWISLGLPGITDRRALVTSCRKVSSNSFTQHALTNIAIMNISRAYSALCLLWRAWDFGRLFDFNSTVVT